MELEPFFCQYIFFIWVERTLGNKQHGKKTNTSNAKVPLQIPYSLSLWDGLWKQKLMPGGGGQGVGCSSLPCPPSVQQLIACIIVFPQETGPPAASFLWKYYALFFFTFILRCCLSPNFIHFISLEYIHIVEISILLNTYQGRFEELMAVRGCISWSCDGSHLQSVGRPEPTPTHVWNCLLEANHRYRGSWPSGIGCL